VATLKKYPRIEDIRALLSDEVIAERVADMSNYSKVDTLATYSPPRGDLDTAVLRKWFDFFDAVRKARPDVTMDNSWTISRSKTPEELIEVVVDAERTRRYYHPEDYPEYGDEDIDYK